jgi:MFS family permease
MGYTNNQSQLLTVPPYFLGCIVTICGGFLADKYKKRGPYMMFFCVVAITGFVILISTRNPHLQYFGTFLVVSGYYNSFLLLCLNSQRKLRVYPTLPMVLTWNGNNIGGTTKRAVGIAMQVAFGNIAGIIAAFTFQTQDAPRYFFGFGLLLAMVAMSLVLSFCMHIYLKRENVGRDEAMKEKGLTFEAYTEEMMSLERKKGDGAAVGGHCRSSLFLSHIFTWQFFRYTI